MPERILGGGRTCGVSFCPFLNSSGWWWLVSSTFLSGTSCHKTTHAGGYYGAWPGWAASISVLALTMWVVFSNRKIQLIFYAVFLFCFSIFISPFPDDTVTNLFFFFFYTFFLIYNFSSFLFIFVYMIAYSWYFEHFVCK